MTELDRRDGTRAATATPAVRTDTRSERLLALVQRQGSTAVLVVVFVLACALSPGFADLGNFQSILVGNAYTALLALAMTFVIISGGIDLSVGSMFALGGVLAGWGVTHGGAAVAVLLPLAVCGLIGAVHGLLISRARLAPFIVTLAGLLFARGLLQAMSDEGSTTYLVPPGSAFLALGAGTWRPVLTAVVLFALGALVLTRTRFGQALFAIGGSEQAALLMGLPVVRTKTLVYTLSGLLRADRDRRRGHRRHAAHRRRRLAGRYRVRRAAAGGDRQPDRRAPVPVRLVGVRPGQRRVPGRRGAGPDRADPPPTAALTRIAQRK
jgi:ABC-type xylose transport system permease subunit